MSGSPVTSTPIQRTKTRVRRPDGMRIASVDVGNQAVRDAAAVLAPVRAVLLAAIALVPTEPMEQEEREAQRVHVGHEGPEPTRERPRPVHQEIARVVDVAGAAPP